MMIQPSPRIIDLNIKSPSLREIDISGYEGRKFEASLMKWLHATAPALQRIKLTIRLATGSGHLLSSPCCPHMQKLRLTRIAGLEERQLVAGELSELSLEGRGRHRPDLRRLKLDTPN
ncbi:hypothetical protein E2562_016576 [Oryza meyeriana var. granulata]|uniref:FBD domain-containing protein n=1 Tax=Oryza meyeriana var. granulata TaxID=110450 RepID=A0A6G1C6S4_9ORYZ|nr:hypothetical protein E2562_016576 [Oryza meyeriana var. granulata]